MQILKKESYRSTGRLVNQDDDMYRVTVSMAKHEYRKFAELVVEKLTAPNTPSAKCYSVECPAIWHDKCTSTKYEQCGVCEQE